MKPTQIFSVLSLAKKVREQDRTFNPCFVSPPGLGKSEIVQQWAREQGYGFVDLRAALLEAPDLIGFPTIVNKEGRQRTEHALPDYWPDENTNTKGVMFLDEVNRGTTSVMNCFMQLLTDRKVKDYKLPAGWIIVAAINPENEQHDVNAMDAALKDRLEFFEVEYDKKTHLQYMETTGYHQILQLFIESGAWQYSRPEEISNVAGSKYLSPRTFSKLNNALLAGIPDDMELIVYDSILGTLMGRAFFQFKNNDQPVTFEEMQKNMKKAMKRLSSFCNPENYKTGHVSITQRSLLENEKQVKDEMLYEVILAIGPEQAMGLIRELEFKRKVEAGSLLNKLTTEYSDLVKYFRNTLAKEKK